MARPPVPHARCASRPWPPDAERDASLRRVALHEYAHWHVARAFGIAGHVQVTPRTATEAAADGERFAGCFVPLLPLVASPAAQVIALAGVCADARDAAGDHVTAALLWAELARGARRLSDGDAAFAGDYRETHVAEALRLVADAWSAIERDAGVHAAALDRWHARQAALAHGSASYPGSRPPDAP